MRRLFFLLCFVLTMTGFSRAQDSVNNNQTHDTTIVDSETMNVWNSPENQQRNIDAIVRLQQDLNDRKVKEKRSAMIKIGFGVLMLVVLIVGLRRRKAAGR